MILCTRTGTPSAPHFPSEHLAQQDPKEDAIFALRHLVVRVDMLPQVRRQEGPEMPADVLDDRVRTQLDGIILVQQEQPFVETCK